MLTYNRIIIITTLAINATGREISPHTTDSIIEEMAKRQRTLWSTVYQDQMINVLDLVAYTDTHIPGVEEAWAQDHDGLAGALLQLHLDGAELAVYDADHAFDLFGRDGSCSRLLPQQVHHMGGELIARLDAQTDRIQRKNNYQRDSTASDRRKRRNWILERLHLCCWASASQKQRWQCSSSSVRGNKNSLN